MWSFGVIEIGVWDSKRKKGREKKRRVYKSLLGGVSINVGCQIVTLFFLNYLFVSLSIYKWNTSMTNSIKN